MSDMRCSLEWSHSLRGAYRILKTRNRGLLVPSSLLQRPGMLQRSELEVNSIRGDALGKECSQGRGRVWWRKGQIHCISSSGCLAGWVESGCNAALTLQPACGLSALSEGRTLDRGIQPGSVQWRSAFGQKFCSRDCGLFLLPGYFACVVRQT